MAVGGDETVKESFLIFYDWNLVWLLGTYTSQLGRAVRIFVDFASYKCRQFLPLTNSTQRARYLQFVTDAACHVLRQLSL